MRVILGRSSGGMHGPRDLGGSNHSSRHGDNSDDNNSWHYWRSYCATGNILSTFPTFSCLLFLANLRPTFDRSKLRGCVLEVNISSDGFPIPSFLIVLNVVPPLAG